MDEIQRFFMNHALCYTASRIHKISSIFSNVIGDGGISLTQNWKSKFIQSRSRL